MNEPKLAEYQATMSEPSRMKLRTTIMLISMIALPAVAVVGIKWPAFLRTERAWTSEKSSPGSSLSRTAAPGRTNRTAPNNLATTAVNAKPLAATDRDTVSSEPLNYPVAQAQNIDVRSTSGGAVMPAVGGNDPASNPVGLLTGDVQPLEVQTNEEFTRIQQRLRGLGATHYVLETWGATGEAYRFQCRMAAGHDAHYSRHFEATDVEPLRAMRTVLEEVESWKSGRLP